MANLCQDIYESNANDFLRELQTKLSKLQSVKDNADPDGDFAYTVGRNIGMINSALMAARTHHQNTMLPIINKDKQ